MRIRMFRSDPDDLLKDRLILRRTRINIYNNKL